MKNVKMGKKKAIRCLKEIIKNIEDSISFDNISNKNHLFKWCRYWPSKGRRGLMVVVIK